MNKRLMRKALAVALAFTPALGGAAAARAAETTTVAFVTQQPQSDAERAYADALTQALTPAQMQDAYQQYLDRIFPPAPTGGA